MNKRRFFPIVIIGIATLAFPCASLGAPPASGVTPKDPAKQLNNDIKNLGNVKDANDFFKNIISYGDKMKTVLPDGKTVPKLPSAPNPFGPLSTIMKVGKTGMEIYKGGKEGGAYGATKAAIKAGASDVAGTYVGNGVGIAVTTALTPYLGPGGPMIGSAAGIIAKKATQSMVKGGIDWIDKTVTDHNELKKLQQLPSWGEYQNNRDTYTGAQTRIDILQKEADAIASNPAYRSNPGFVSDNPRMKQIQAELKAARERRDAAEASMRRAKLKVEAEIRQRDHDTLADLVKKLKGELDAMTGGVDPAAINHDRVGELEKKLDQAKTDLQDAATELESAKQALQSSVAQTAPAAPSPSPPAASNLKAFSAREQAIIDKLVAYYKLKDGVNTFNKQITSVEAEFHRESAKASGPEQSQSIRERYEEKLTGLEKQKSDLNEQRRKAESELRALTQLPSIYSAWFNEYIPPKEMLNVSNPVMNKYMNLWFDASPHSRMDFVSRVKSKPDYDNAQRALAQSDTPSKPTSPSKPMTTSNASDTPILYSIDSTNAVDSSGSTPKTGTAPVTKSIQTKSAARDAVRSAVKNTVKDTVKDSIKDSVKDTTKDTTKDATKDSAASTARSGCRGPCRP